MKILLICLLFSSLFVEKRSQNVTCENGGCYEVIKLFAELLEQKINATDVVLAQAENELNEISFGNDETFKTKIKEVGDKLTHLLEEMNTGVDGGDKTLFALINSIFDSVGEIEVLAEEVEIDQEGALKNTEGLDTNLENTQETIREIQKMINRLQNATTYEGPQALQDAFDRSEKFNAHSSELRKVLDQMKLILVDYEDNLVNAKNHTSIAIEKFVEVSQQASETLDKQERVDDILEELDDIKLSKDELNSLKTIVKKSLAEAKAVHEDSFDLLSEVTEFELINKLDNMNKKIEELNRHSDATQLSLEQFDKDNAKFLDEMEKTIDAAVVFGKRAGKLHEEIKQQLKTINDIHEDAAEAISKVDSTVEDAKNIAILLEDFNLKVEMSKENARMALEKISAVRDKIAKSVKIVEKLENSLDEKTRKATDVKKKCTEAKEQMDGILETGDEIKARIKELEKNLDTMTQDNDLIDKEEIGLSNEFDKLEKREADDSKFIEETEEKIEKTKSKAKETDTKVDEAFKSLQELSDAIAQLKGIDQQSLKDFEINLNKVEKDLEESHLNHNLVNLKAKHFEQQELLGQYLLEITELEYQISVIKRNAESLENRCFKRTRLEP